MPNLREMDAGDQERVRVYYAKHLKNQINLQKNTVEYKAVGKSVACQIFRTSLYNLERRV